MSYDVEDSTILSALRPLIAPGGDLLCGLALTAVGVITALTTTGTVRILLSLPLVVVVPGYALVSALYPAKPSHARRPVPGLGTRAALAVGVSISISIPLLFLLGTTDIGLATQTVVVGLGTVSAVGYLLAGGRRIRLRREHRFHLPFRRWAQQLYTGVFRQDSPVDVVLNVALVVAVVLGVSALGYALVFPAGSASFSSFSLLTDGGGGDPVAGNYSTDLVQGTQEEFLLAVENHEHENTAYTIVAQLQQVDTASGTVTEHVRLQTVSNTVAADTTWNPRVGVTPRLTGDTLRLAFFLYTGDAPRQATSDTAEEQLYLWVDVSDR